jgi:hypothetical protein
MTARTRIGATLAAVALTLGDAAELLRRHGGHVLVQGREGRLHDLLTP